MKRFTMKRITALVLALIMTLSLCPMTALAESLTAEWFLVNRFRCWDPYDGSAKVIAEVTVDTVQTIIDSEWIWNNSLDETERSRVNDAIAAQAEEDGLEVKTYDQLLAEAKEKAIPLFVAAYAKDANGTLIDISVPENVSWENICRIHNGLEPWEALNDEQKAAVNAQLNGVTFDDMLRVAVQEYYSSTLFETMYLKEGGSIYGNLYTTITANNAYWLNHGKTVYKYMSSEVQGEVDAKVNANFASIKETGTSLTYDDIAMAANFVNNYLRDWNNEELITKLDSNSSVDVVRSVTRGEATWGTLTTIQQTAVNKSLKNADADAQTYEQMLEYAVAQNFINLQLCDQSGNIYTTATFDNAEKLCVGKMKFDAMSTDQQAIVRNLVPNVDDLLTSGDFIQNVLRRYDSDTQTRINIIEITNETVVNQLVYQYERLIGTMTSAQIAMVDAALEAAQTAAEKTVKSVAELYEAAKEMLLGQQLEVEGKTADSYIEKFLSYEDGSTILDIASVDAQYVVNRLVHTWEYWRNDGIVEPKLAVAEQEKVNTALAEAQTAAGKPVKTVQQLRAEAYEKYPDETFIANTLVEWLNGDTTKKLDPVTSVNSNNFVRLFAGIDEWNRMPQFFKDDVNQRRTNAGLSTYETLYNSLTEEQKADALIIMHLGGWNKDTPTVVTSKTKCVAIGARYEWDYLTDEGKVIVNDHIQARVDEDIASGAITQDQVKYTTYPQMLEVSLARDFVDTYLLLDDGSLITEVTESNMMRILNGVSPWYWGIVTKNGETKTAHDWVNDELTAANGGVTLTYPMLLEQALELLYKNIAICAPVITDEMYDMFYKSIFSKEANAELAGLVNEALVKGNYISIKPIATEVSRDDVATDATKVDAYVDTLTDGEVLSYFDLFVWVTAPGSTLGGDSISELDEEVTFTLNIPEDQYDSSKEYVLVRVHDGVAEELETTKNDDGTLSIKTDKFSTYAVVEKTTTPAEARWGLATGTNNDQAPADDAWVESGTLEDAMAYANSVTSGTAYIQLLSDVDTTAPLKFDGDITTILDLNGNDIDRGLTEETENGNVIIVYGNLTLCDTSADAATTPGKIMGGYTTGSGGGVDVRLNGTFTMNGGTISGNTADAGGVGVSSDSAFTMNGGAISGNTAQSFGGGVSVGGAFTMNGGTISENTANNYCGGGVDVRFNGTFTINDGAISDNTAKFAGGVYAHGTFMMNGGAVSENTAGSGGGVYASGTFTMNGGTISENAAEGVGGGVHIFGTFTMNDGTIRGNTATEIGGGVYAHGTMMISGKPVISGNLVNRKLNNVWLQSGNAIIVTGALKDDASIGVKTATAPTATVSVAVAQGGGDPVYTITASDAAKFTSDSGYLVELDSANNQILLAKKPGVTVSGTVTSYLDATADVTIELFANGSITADYTTTITGNSASYSIEGVAAGTYTMKVCKVNHVTREYTVTVGDTDVTQDAKIHPVGDINGDGRVNITDVGMANSHAKRVSTLTGYAYDCGNVNGDTRINISDVGMLNAHAKRTNTLW